MNNKWKPDTTLINGLLERAFKGVNRKAKRVGNIKINK
jgi:hypothetical protein